MPPPPPASTSWPYANLPCCTLSRRYQPCDRIAACAARLTQIDGAAALMHLLYLAKWNIYYSETERASTQTRKSQRDDGDRTRNRGKRWGRIAMITVAGSAWGLLTLKFWPCAISLYLSKDRSLCRLRRMEGFAASWVFWSGPSHRGWPLSLPSSHVIASLALDF